MRGCVCRASSPSSVTHMKMIVLCNSRAVPRPRRRRALTSPPRSSTKKARIIGLCATTGAEPARPTVCGSCVGSPVSTRVPGTHSAAVRGSFLELAVGGLAATESAALGHLGDTVLLPNSPWMALLRPGGPWDGPQTWQEPARPHLPVRLSGRGRARPKTTRLPWPRADFLQPPLRRRREPAASGCCYFKRGSRGAR